MREGTDYSFGDISNPLDCADQLPAAAKLSFNRPTNDELLVQAEGRFGTYVMMFVWDETAGALQFGCDFGLKVSECNLMPACKAILQINSGLWLGHFDLPLDNLVPTYRHTQIFRGMSSSGADHLHDLIQIAVRECDRHYPLFAKLGEDQTPDADTISLAMMVPAGQS